MKIVVATLLLALTGCANLPQFDWRPNLDTVKTAATQVQDQKDCDFEVAKLRGSLYTNLVEVEAARMKANGYTKIRVN